MAINVAIYDRQGGWAMTERGRASLTRSPTMLRVGPSGLTVDGNVLTVDFDERAAPLPRRLKGRIRVEMPAVQTTTHLLERLGDHVWRPIAPVARMEVELDGPARRWSGDAYVDHNRGDEPLEAGFRTWSWARASDTAGTSIVYAVEPRHAAPRRFLLDVRPDGGSEVTTAPPPMELGRTGWALRRPAHSDMPAESRVIRTLEDAPFYSRSVVRLGLGGRLMTGIHESLSLDRFRRPVVQMMLPFRMPRWT